ncbi:hypothetical protein [Paenibacillus sp. YN15]|uniref:hypothetical protein n=1 Tax=Paenibacillus sp. YN15 TaxID=1742774 RepID=UPI000DCF0C97|nr:hypothetical protein [Paenibacillus sp. YN15]RAV03112.1 hypothetical protein DQG13_08660 [Paenibacillus sp. YN15]
MDDTKELLLALLKNVEIINAKVTGGLDRVETDLRSLRQELGEFKSEMHEFKSEMYEFKNEMHQFKDEMYAFRDETSRNFKELRDDLGEFKTETKTELRRLRRGQIALEHDLDQTMADVEQLKEQMNLQKQ